MTTSSWLYAITLPMIAYIFGSIPFGWLIGKAQGVNIQVEGSGNTGAANVTRLLGITWGILTLLLDTGKGFFIVSYAHAMLPQWNLSPDLAILLAGTPAVLGHCFPPYASIHFRGGKGVAVTFGIALQISPLLALVAFVVFVAAVAATRYISLGSMISVWVFAFWLALASAEYHPWIAGSGCVLAAIVVAVHYQNLGCLVRGEERKFNSGGKQ